MRSRWAPWVAALAVGCAPVSVPASSRVEAPRAPAAADPSVGELEPLLRADAELVSTLDEAERRRVQVLVAVPTTGPDGRTVLRRLAFRADAEYFYPASAVKLFAAYAALEKLDDLRAEAGVPLTTTTPLRFVEGEGRTRRVVETTLRRELELSLVISDNDAFNRLYELVGRDELAERLARIGLGATRVVQHLGDGPTANAPPPVIELLPPSAPAVQVSQRLGFRLPPAPSKVLLGRSHLDAHGRLVDGPMDFADKNVVPLRELQDMLVAIVRPELYDRGTVPALSAREELLAILGELPSELVRSRKARTLDTKFKPLHLAIASALPDDRVRVYGKGGRAYGFAIENAYAVSETTGRSFFVAATIYANDNELMNDDRYEYEAVASPFVTRLGTVLARMLLAEGRPY